VFFAIPKFGPDGHLDVVPPLKLLDSLQAFSPAHDSTVPEGDLDTGHLIFNPKFDVLAIVPVVVRGLYYGLNHLCFNGQLLYIYPVRSQGHAALPRAAPAQGMQSFILIPVPVLYVPVGQLRHWYPYRYLFGGQVVGLGV